MAEVIWTEPALQELDAIAEYIALDNFTAASQLVSAVFEKTKRLESFPNRGELRQSFRTPFIESWWHHPAELFIVKMTNTFSSSLL